VNTYYQVAGHIFGVSGSAEISVLMDNYEPFRVNPPVGDPVFMLTISLIPPSVSGQYPSGFPCIPSGISCLPGMRLRPEGFRLPEA
jgi:hypothetical protein